MRVGILGGTFDPIHLGHLAVADAASAAFEFTRILVVPSNHPPHRPVEPHATACHRFAMVALALADRPRMVASDVELQANDLSYTAVTLRRLHAASLAPLQLFFLTGADAFAEIATWKDYPAILDLANFVVVSRPHHPAAGMLERLPMLRDRMIMCPVAGAAHRASDQNSPRIWLLEAPTPDVSSTEVRRRVREGQAVQDLVPRAVARYIERQSLYRPALAAPGSRAGEGG
jgi:nicotinate-nucleotide adenylyltransferase